MWDRELTTPKEAEAIRTFFSQRDGREEDSRKLRFFKITVAQVHEIAAKHKRTLDVVRDPISDCDLAGVDGHSLIEGLRWPDAATREASRVAHETFLDDLVQKFEEVPPADW